MCTATSSGKKCRTDWSASLLVADPDSGVATELAVQLPAVTAKERGLRALVVVDACGGTSERTEHAALTGPPCRCSRWPASSLATSARPAAQQAIGVVYEMAAG